MTCKECMFQLPIPCRSVFSGIIHSSLPRELTSCRRDVGAAKPVIFAVLSRGDLDYRVEFKRLDEDFFGEE